MNKSRESLRPPSAPLVPTSEAVRRRSPRLAWAITLGESALVAGAAFPLVKYWLMLPAPIRLGAAVVLVSLALVVIFRILRFHLHWAGHQNGRPHSPTPPPKIEPEPATVRQPVTDGKLVSDQISSKKRVRSTTVLMPSGSSPWP